jgi:plasmid stabilization system protein ParE
VKVRYSARAVSDLARIADYLIERSSQGARSVDRSIQRTIDLIAAFPGSGRTLEQRPPIRVMPVNRYPYLIFYTMRADEIVILHVRHGARAPIDPAQL